MLLTTQAQAARQSRLRDTLPTVFRPWRLMVMLLTVALTTGFAAPAEAAILLGTAESFAVLGASTVTNTGPSTLLGDVGVSPGTAIIGFPPGVVAGGTIHSNDAVATQARSDATTAYVVLSGLPVDQVLTGVDLGGLTLTPGVYFFSSSAQLTGTLTLDGLGQADPQFVFQIGSTLTTASQSSVVLMNGADACDIFFQIGSSATLGTNTMFAGTIIASESITLTTQVTLEGRALALGGAVTLDTNAIVVPFCAPVPEPSSLLIVAGLGISSQFIRRRRAGSTLCKQLTK